MNHFLFIIFLLNMYINNAEKSKCATCTEFSTKFLEGVIKTSASNFGGGNTNWEEKNLGSYTYSETRFLEILDSTCPDKDKLQCHQLVEENEEVLETWWSKHYAKGTDLDLFLFLCVESLKICCPNGKFGKDCESCPGGSEHPCNDRGVCQGNGTRKGDGKCTCHAGYLGETCDECQTNFYRDKSADQLTCLACHPACKGACSGEGPAYCLECQDGWSLDIEKGCLDVDECAENLYNCSHNTYCSNIEGRYNCPDCHSSCNGCSAYGHNKCLECARRHILVDDICKECHPSCANSCTDETATTCDSCKEGWVLSDNNECTDIDECLSKENNNCTENSYCVNTPGNFSCLGCHELCTRCQSGENKNCTKCKAGFATNEEGECIDIDECLDSTTCAGEFEKCVNTPGTFKCNCVDGYVRRMGSECFKKNIVKKKKVPTATLR